MERSADPFDARRSGREPFPCFDAAMALGNESDNSDSDSDENGAGGCVCDSATPGSFTRQSLDWSIDGLATLVPRAFSPLPFQFSSRPRHALRRRRRWSTGATSTASSTPTVSAIEDDTPPRSATFFVNETEYGILRTPADVIAQETTTAMAIGIATDSRWRELHRRCVDTMQFCEARLRERQQRLARLPIPATKLTLQRRIRRYSDTPAKTPTPSQESTRSREPLMPVTPVRPTRLSFGSIDLSPIPFDATQHISLHLDASTPEPKTPVSLSSPALSSIAEHPADVLTPSFASLQFSDEEKENKESSPASDASSSSLQTKGSLSVTASPSFSSDDGASISARQHSFIAAIEEEAEARDAIAPANATTRASPSPQAILRQAPRPATSMASIYKEARALGLTEPTAQWEYVQLIRRQTTRESLTVKSRASL